MWTHIRAPTDLGRRRRFHDNDCGDLARRNAVGVAGIRRGNGRESTRRVDTGEIVGLTPPRTGRAGLGRAR